MKPILEYVDNGIRLGMREELKDGCIRSFLPRIELDDLRALQDELNKFLSDDDLPETHEEFVIQHYEPGAREGLGEWWEDRDYRTYPKDVAISYAKHRSEDSIPRYGWQRRYRVVRERVIHDVVYDSGSTDGNED